MEREKACVLFSEQLSLKSIRQDRARQGPTLWQFALEGISQLAQNKEEVLAWHKRRHGVGEPTKGLGRCEWEGGLQRA